MPRHVGFTGTQHRGMTLSQRMEFENLLRPDDVVHHGDCVGADKDADTIARRVGCKVVIHPPDNDSKRAFCAQPGDEVRKPLPYLVRNRDIVNESETVIAAPRTAIEELRSGTWATIRYARQKRRSLIILRPAPFTIRHEHGAPLQGGADID